MYKRSEPKYDPKIEADVQLYYIIKEANKMIDKKTENKIENKSNGRMLGSEEIFNYGSYGLSGTMGSTFVTYESLSGTVGGTTGGIFEMC